MDKIVKEIERRINSLKIESKKSEIENGQIWARKDELTSLLNFMKKNK